ncbi:hypothetical protein [Micromonospora sp. b486]|uniref:hypothetical protein n=1 Tax=Micromonospora sp. b486 TaxID=3053986 RepID=UPI00259CB502|nr:hypothetical protein [Micromonospora sp. b486]MDM4784560.1 hypothetical protein [Micromonospora sp. b486]
MRVASPRSAAAWARSACARPAYTRLVASTAHASRLVRSASSPRPRSRAAYAWRIAR